MPFPPLFIPLLLLLDFLKNELCAPPTLWKNFPPVVRDPFPLVKEFIYPAPLLRIPLPNTLLPLFPPKGGKLFPLLFPPLANVFPKALIPEPPPPKPVLPIMEPPLPVFPLPKDRKFLPLLPFPLLIFLTDYRFCPGPKKLFPWL